MLRQSRCAGLLALTLLGSAASAAAQEPSSVAVVPRVGLVLSGGSAKGFAHIGVLAELERAGVPIDRIGGTSLGGIVGALFSIGYSPAALRRVAEQEEWSELFREATPRSAMAPVRKLAASRFLVSIPVRGNSVDLPTAIIGSQGLSAVLARLLWSADTIADLTTLPIPFVVVATDLETGAAVPIRRGPLSVAVRASMSLPGVFTPVKFDGRRLVDGGVARNLPAQDVLALGADFLICVDVSDGLAPADSLRSAFGILMQVMSFHMDASNAAERARCDVLVSPDVRGLSAASFEEATLWVERGADAARRAMPQILERLAARGIPTSAVAEERKSASPPPAAARRLRFRGVQITGDPGAPIPSLFLPPVERGTPLSAVDAEQIAARLYASGRYSIVASRPLRDGDVVDLLLDVIPANQDRIGVGLRYDSRYQASLLFGLELFDRLGTGSATSVEMRLGEQISLLARHRLGANGEGRFVRALSVNYVRTPLDLFDSGLAVARTNVHVATVAAFVGTTFPRSSLTGLQVAWEASRAGDAFAPIPVPTVSQAFGVASLISWTETFDRAEFPTRGLSLALQIDAADRNVGNGATFVRSVAELQLRLPVASGTSLLGEFAAGAAHGADVPIYRNFFLGGATSSAVLGGGSFAFPALRSDARMGRALQLASLGVQQSVGRNFFLTGKGTIGNTFDRWPGLLAREAYLIGTSATIGALTPVGPASLTLAGRRLDAWPLVSVEFGFRF